MGWIFFTLGLFIGTVYGTILGESKGKKTTAEEKRRRENTEKKLAHIRKRSLEYEVRQNEEIEHLKGANYFLRTEYQRRKLQ